MNVAEQFNSLNGKVATRKQLEKIADLSFKEEQFHIYERIQSVLSNNVDKKFVINIHEKAFEIAPKSMLNGLYFEEITDEANNGLNKAVSSSEIYQMITDKMLAMIKEASGKGYVQKWKGKTYGKGYTIPFNFDTKKRYRGVNVFLLTTFEPLENPFFMTFKQIEAHKGLLKKGSKGFPVVYFTNLYKITDKQLKIDFGTYDLKKAKEFAIKNGFSEDKIKTLPILKYYNVFNGKDIEGINFDLENFKIGYIEKELPNTEKLPIAEAIIKNYPVPAPKLKHGGNDAFYSPSGDFIQMPHIADFETVQDYYRTLFHEFSHSTGAYDRLARDFSGRFGSKPYAFEELVAEWGATFLSAEAGIIWHSNKNHAEYLKNWNSALTHLKDDNKFIMKACTKAQELTDFVLQFDDNGTPKYLENLKKEATKIEIKKAVSKVKKTTKKQIVKPSIEPVSKVQKKKKKQTISSKYKEKSIVVWEGKPVSISKIVQFGNELKFELDLGKNKTIWTDKNTLDSEAKKQIKEPVKVVKKTEKGLKKINVSNGLMDMTFDTLPINKEWEELMQNPASNLKIAIWGAPKNGKTAGSLQMANYFTNFGNVLYNFADQGFNKSTQDLWISSGLSENPKAFPSDISSIDELEKEIATGKYKFVFIDMISDYIRTEKIKPEEFKARFIKKYPNVSFILIFEVTKGGNFKGDQGWTHLVDAIMTVEDFLIENRGRYGIGHRIIWEEGLKKFNPKKYEEIKPKEEKKPALNAVTNHTFSFIVN